MVKIDMSGSSVLITGGTRGIGRAAALAFAAAGARLFLTYKWGSADTDELVSEFEKTGSPPPTLIQADASVEEDTESLMKKIASLTDRLDVFISNVGFALRTQTLEQYKKRSLFKTLEYSTWPLIDYTRRIKEHTGQYPRYIIGVSSDGPDHYYRGYDFVAASKALLEFFSRYLSVHLADEDCRVNVIRFGTVATESFQAVFGDDFFDFLKDSGVPESRILTPEDCGKAILAMCSGLLDAVNGQIISVDHGLPFQDNTMMRYIRDQTLSQDEKV